MKRRTVARLFAVILGLVGAGVILLAFRPRERDLPVVTESNRLEAYLLLLSDLPEQTADYLEYIRQNPLADSGSAEPIALIQSPGITLEPGVPATLRFTVSGRANHQIVLRHRRTDEGLINASIRLLVDGELPFSEARKLEIPRLWSDQTKAFSRDRYNDESLPLQVASFDWIEGPLRDGSGRTVQPLYVNLDAGRHEIQVENLSGHPVEIQSLRLEPLRYPPSYDEYRRGLAATTPEPGDTTSLMVNATEYISKNSYDLRMGSLTDTSVYPADPVDRLLNIIDGRSWESSGEEITFPISAPADGDYTLTIHYNNPRSDLAAFRTILVDGEVPFAELAPYAFPATGGSRWRNETLSQKDGEPLRIRLSEGEHTLTMRAEMEPVQEAIRALKIINAHMNYFGIEIMKVAGREIDENRTWRLTDYIANTPRYLDAYEILVSDIIQDLSNYTRDGIDSNLSASLFTALFKLEKLAEDPDELPIYLQDIYSTSIYDRPVTQILGDTVNLLEECTFSLDMILVESVPTDPRENAPLFERIAGVFKSVVATFTSDKYVTRNSPGELNVWVARPITHIDLMQKMVDAGFSQATGVPVKISVMPDQNRLILATAANTTPDLAMGLQVNIPFDLAVRGAAYDLSSFPDFWAFASDFSPGAFIPYIMNERAYAMPETIDFHTLVYRTDIFDQLELTPPDTWDDVIEILPVLQRYGMNFYHPVAGRLPTLKYLDQTAPFVYQYGGRLYGADGLSVSLDNPATVQGLTFLSELFTLYALPQQVPNFYNSFRFGVTPVGIVDSQNYLQMKYAAPELNGQWALAPYPGIPDENGDPQRWFISNGVSAVIMADTGDPQASWDYLKWWLSEDVQIDFGYRLQSTYGPEYLWVSGNLRALEKAPIDDEDKDVILEQVKWQRDVPRSPAQYMLDRGLSDIWINSATQNTPVRTEIDAMIPVIDREVKRKMIEFGFVDAEGNSLRPFVIPDIDWIIEQFNAAKTGEAM